MTGINFPACPAWAVFVLINAILILAALAEQLKQQRRGRTRRRYPELRTGDAGRGAAGIGGERRQSKEIEELVAFCLRPLP